MDNQEKKKMSFKEMWSNPRYKAMIKMGLWLALIVIIILYINISAYFQASINTTIPNVKDTSYKDDFLTNLYSQNYAFNLDITINDGEEQVINYHGKRNEHEVYVVKNNDLEYYISNDSFYRKINGQYELTSIDDLFDDLEYRYFQLENIKEYLKKGNIEHNTNSGSNNVTTLLVPINMILLNQKTNDNITVTILEEPDKLTMTLDYTNLMKLTNDKVTNYQVKIEYTMVNQIENELNNDIGEQ